MEVWRAGRQGEEHAEPDESPGRGPVPPTTEDIEQTSADPAAEGEVRQQRVEGMTEPFTPEHTPGERAAHQPRRAGERCRRGVESGVHFEALGLQQR